jgi:hypothetical protein
MGTFLKTHHIPDITLTNWYVDTGYLCTVRVKVLRNFSKNGDHACAFIVVAGYNTQRITTRLKSTTQR